MYCHPSSHGAPRGRALTTMRSARWAGGLPRDRTPSSERPAALGATISPARSVAGDPSARPAAENVGCWCLSLRRGRNQSTPYLLLLRGGPANAITTHQSPGSSRSARHFAAVCPHSCVSPLTAVSFAARQSPSSRRRTSYLEAAICALRLNHRKNCRRIIDFRKPFKATRSLIADEPSRRSRSGRRATCSRARSDNRGRRPASRRSPERAPDARDGGCR